MPKTIQNQSTQDSYSSPSTIEGVYSSSGGWISLSDQVICQLEYSIDDGSQGSERWSDEFIVPAGAHIIEANVIGIRFRNFAPSTPVIVSATIFYPKEPIITLGSAGISTPGVTVSNLSFEHNGAFIGSEPTADFEDETNGDNLLWTVVDDGPDSRVKITPVWNNPITFPHDIVAPGILANSPADGLGYGVGAGGHVTQIVVRSNPVTLNSLSGQITTMNDAVGPGTYFFTVNNSEVLATDTIVLTAVVVHDPTDTFRVNAVGNGSFRISYTSANSMSTAYVFNFAVLRVATS